MTLQSGVVGIKSVYKDQGVDRTDIIQPFAIFHPPLQISIKISCDFITSSPKTINMNSAVVLALFAVLAVAAASPGFLGAPAVAPVAYAGPAPLAYAAPAFAAPVLRAPVAYAGPAFAAPFAAPVAPVAYGKAFLG